MASAKLTFHVKKLMNAVGTTSSDPIVVDQVLKALLVNYKEYELQPSAELRAEVSKLVENFVVEKQNSLSRVDSLNQVLTNKYSKLPAGTGRLTPSAVTEAEVTLETSQGASSVGRKRKKVDSSTGESNAETSNAMSLSALELSRARYLHPRPTTRLNSLAGIEQIISQIRELVFYPIQYANLYQHLGVRPPCGLLLHGPSGCGKTTLATAIAGELNLPFFKASGPELVGSASGESEERVRQIFQAAFDSAPAVLFVDGIDVIASKKESTQRGMDRRIVAQLCDSIDMISDPNEPADNKMVVLIAATNKAEALDVGVRGRFSRELPLPVPDAPAREKILMLLSAGMRLAPDIDFAVLGRATPGYVGADLKALVKEAGMKSVARIIASHKVGEETSSELVSASSSSERVDAVLDTVHSSEVENIGEVDGETRMCTDICEANEDLDKQHSRSNAEFFPPEDAFICPQDFFAAMKSIQPTAKREGFAVVPDVSWNDVGALCEVREELLHNVLDPIANPERYRSLGLDIPAGVLFFGPPGCGKTLLAKAVANQSGANFISVKGPELLNMYVGESESRVRQVFARARDSAPCVIFFDELDALCPRRGSGFDGGGNGVSERVVNQLLTELDGLETRKDVYCIAATNRLELIDEAMLRPGRLGKLLYVPLPSADDRVGILSALTRKLNVETSSDVSSKVDLRAIGSDIRAEGFSGADLAALVREAGLCVIKEWRQSGLNENVATGPMSTCLKAHHFEAALSIVRPSVSESDRKRYELIHQQIKRGMGAIQAIQHAMYILSRDGGKPMSPT